MGFKIVVVLLVCTSLLTTPVLGTAEMASAMANTAIQGASMLGTSMALKGGAMLGMKKGLLTNLTMKAAKMKGAMLSAFLSGMMKGKMQLMSAQKPSLIDPSKIPSILQLLTSIVSSVPKTMGSVSRTEETVIVQRPRYVYEYVTGPRYYTVPLVK